MPSGWINDPPRTRRDRTPPRQGFAVDPCSSPDNSVVTMRCVVRLRRYTTVSPSGVNSSPSSPSGVRVVLRRRAVPSRQSNRGDGRNRKSARSRELLKHIALLHGKSPELNHLTRPPYSGRVNPVQGGTGAASSRVSRVSRVSRGREGAGRDEGPKIPGGYWPG